MWSDGLVVCDCGFQSDGSLLEKDKRFMEAPWWERLTEWETGPCKMVATLKNRLAFSYKSKYILTVKSSSCVPWYLPKGVKILFLVNYYVNWILEVMMCQWRPISYKEWTTFWVWWLKVEKADKTRKGLGMQEWKNQTLIVLPSPCCNY